MSQPEVQRFASDLKANSALRAEARNLALRPASAVVEFAARRGYCFTVEDTRSLIKAKAEAAGRPLSQDQLDASFGFPGRARCLCMARDPQGTA